MPTIQLYRMPFNLDYEYSVVPCDKAESAKVTVRWPSNNGFSFVEALEEAGRKVEEDQWEEVEDE